MEEYLRSGGISRDIGGAPAWLVLTHFQTGLVLE